MTIDFQTDPSRYRHWQVTYDGSIAWLTMDVDEKGGLFEGYLFSGIYGASAADPGERCMFSDGSLPAKVGTNYHTLVGRTGGERLPICEDNPTEWLDFMRTVASAVVRRSELACEVPIPTPPDGMILDPARINVEIFGPADRIRLR